MPELPDVEHMRRKLRPARGTKIRDVVVYAHGFVDFESPHELLNATIERIRRRGKFVLVELDTDHIIVAHMGMTGILSLQPSDEPPSYQAKCAFKLVDGRHIDYISTRKLGMLGSAHRDHLARFPLLTQLGPEPLDRSFTKQRFLDLTDGSRARIKPFLMDQRHIAGLGNLCVDEILYQARIHPETALSDLSTRQRTALFHTLKRTVRKMVDGYEHEGRMRSLLINHRSVGEPCPRCHATIRRIVVAGRGTYLCPRCQQR